MMRISWDHAFDAIGAIFEWTLRVGVAVLVLLIVAYLSVIL